MKATPVHEYARQLRREQTDAEGRLWAQLRQRRLGGHRFRRQFPIGNFIVDFCCREQHLVVEVDGGQHLEWAEADCNRGELIEARGYRVLRFWNSDVLSNPEGLLEQILTDPEGRTYRDLNRALQMDFWLLKRWRAKARAHLAGRYRVIVQFDGVGPGQLGSLD